MAKPVRLASARWGRDEGVFDCELFGGNRNSLVVRAALFRNSRCKFQPVFRRNVRNADCQLFRRGFDCGVGDFSGVVVEGFARAQDCGMVDCAAVKFGRGVVAGIATVSAKTTG